MGPILKRRKDNRSNVGTQVDTECTAGESPTAKDVADQ